MADTFSNQAFRQRFQMMKSSEQEKNALIEELLFRLDQLSEDYQTACLDRERESFFNRDVQLRESKLKEEVRRMTNYIDSNPFVLVIIDGDGMIFQDYLLQKAEQGGKETASFLWGAVRDYLREELKNLPSDCKIVTRIYANLKGLAETCYRAGIVDKPSKVEDFARGFTRSKHLFDFIDVGSGKERADNKITEVLKLFLFDLHCRQILFGCSHDNGYAPLLEDYVTEKIYADRITLLEGVPFERELRQLQGFYKSTKFEAIFREAKISVPSPQQQLASMHINGTTSNNQTVHAPATNGIHKTTSNSSVPLSWVSAAAMPAMVASPPTTPKPAPPSTTEIPRNRKGQRIDPEIKYDKFDVKRVKGLKMCNVHFLRGDCGYGLDCTHSHVYKATPSELQTLRYIGRLAPCRMGSDCEEPKCIYGHRCMAGNPCAFGENCRFPAELHNIDTVVVRMTKV